MCCLATSQLQFASPRFTESFLPAPRCSTRTASQLMRAMYRFDATATHLTKPVVQVAVRPSLACRAGQAAGP